MMHFPPLRSMIYLFFALLLGLSGLSYSVPTSAQLPDFPLNIRAQLEAETQTPAAGSTVSIAIAMTPDKGWHGYWENPGDAGVGLRLNWTLPKGVSAGKPRFPIPEKLIISDLMNFTYEGNHSFLIDLKIDDSIPIGTAIPISVEAEWLACTDRICVPERDTLSLLLTIGDGKISPENAKRFGEYRSKLAIPLDQKATYEIRNGQIALAIPLPASANIKQPYFFPVTQSLIDYQAPQNIKRDGDMLILNVKLDDYAIKDFDDELSGVLQIAPDYGIELNAVSGKVESGFSGFSNALDGILPAGSSSLWILLLSAILGGLILNLMPCVFPIIGLKALSLAKLGHDDKAAKKEALSYSAGVILSTMALGGLLLLLRAGGEQIGWAFQLQSPIMLLILFILMILITLNLWGLFELSSINIGQKLTQGSGGSFWTGVLAAFVATPCTGPFMALALGAALVLPTYQAMMLFFGLGFGLALPYLLIAYIPPLRRKMPKSGPWMHKFRKIMAIPMGLTAIALFWLLGRVGGTQAMMIGLISALVAIIFILYIRHRQKHNLNIALWSILAVIGVWTINGFLILDTQAGVHDEQKKWVQVEPYDAQKLAQYRREAKPIFLYFTADWCLTCKANEAAALQREATAKLFEKRNIIVMEGDFTQENPEIANILNQYGSAGVPLYLYFAPNKPAKILPQILTVNILDEQTKN